MKNTEKVQQQLEWVVETFWDGGPDEFIEAGICGTLIELSNCDILAARATLETYYESWIERGNAPKDKDEKQYLENYEEGQHLIECAISTFWDGGPDKSIEAGICWALIELSGRDISFARATLDGWYESSLRHGNTPKGNA